MEKEPPSWLHKGVRGLFPEDMWVWLLHRMKQIHLVKSLPVSVYRVVWTWATVWHSRREETSLNKQLAVIVHAIKLVWNFILYRYCGALSSVNLQYKLYLVKVAFLFFFLGLMVRYGTWSLWDSLTVYPSHSSQQREGMECDRCVIVAFSAKLCWSIHGASVIKLTLESVHSNRSLILCTM